MPVLVPAPLGDDRGARLLRGQPRETLAFVLLDTVGRALVDGAYRHKPFPTDYELTGQYGVSRSVTREAVKMLSAKGLIASRPRLGNFVLSFDGWNLFDPDVLRWLADGSQRCCASCTSCAPLSSRRRRRSPRKHRYPPRLIATSIRICAPSSTATRSSRTGSST
jgi:DNA-binding transcriptional MocR family regulator